MDASLFPALAPVAKRVAPFVVGIAIAGAGVGYAVHEHSGAQNMAAQKQALAAQNQQMTAQLNATQSQLAALTERVNALVTTNEAKPAPATLVTETAGGRRSPAHRANTLDPRFKKMQSQLDAQGKEIDAARSDLDNTRTDLTNTRTELTGSIARTHDELVVLEKKGERSYFEFDIAKSKEFKREGPISIRLSKANTKKGYADLLMIVDDRNLSQKHVNLYQPSMFYEPDSPQPVEIVINDISKDHIHGYVSAPKYRKSELEAMASSNPAPGAQQAANSNSGDNDMVHPDAAAGSDQAANSNVQPAPRKRLPLPSSDPNQQ
jgi:prefoldin subunit 5